MCGIAGIAKPTGHLTPRDKRSVRLMAELIRHRGPDESGIVHHPSASFAAQRLAIVDIAKGQQPRSNARGTASIVFNGEIFNHRELRADLESRGHTFLSRGEAEVCLHLYEEYGMEFVSRLEGQFAIAIWDEPSKTLVLARDRVGICPLFYAQFEDGIYFSSEIKAIIGGSGRTPKLDPRGLAQVACFGAPHAPTTMFQDIKALPPACIAVCDRRGIRIEQYWDLNYPRTGERHPETLENEIEQLRDLLLKAVRTTVPDEVACGTFLSGGIDSGLITALAARERPNELRAFTITSPMHAFDESVRARRAAAFTHVELDELSADNNLIARNFERLIWHAETPVQLTESTAMLALSNMAKEKVKVVLTGEGADEAFAGYWNLRQHWALHNINDVAPAWLRNLARPRCDAYFGRKGAVPSEQRVQDIRSTLGCVPAQAQQYGLHCEVMALVFRPEWTRRLEELGGWDSLGINRERLAGRHWIDQSLYVGYKVLLPDYLLATHGDRVLMANGLEGRYPFLDRNFLEYAAQIPPRQKLTWQTEKYILRRAAAKWLPEDISSVRKKAFSTPLGVPLLDSCAPEVIREVLDAKCIEAFGYFEPSRVEWLIGELELWYGRTPPSADRGTIGHQRRRLGMALTLVVSMQLFHRLFLASDAMRNFDLLPVEMAEMV